MQNQTKIWFTSNLHKRIHLFESIHFTKTNKNNKGQCPCPNTGCPPVKIFKPFLIPHYKTTTLHLARTFKVVHACNDQTSSRPFGLGHMCVHRGLLGSFKDQPCNNGTWCVLRTQLISVSPESLSIEYCRLTIG